MPEIQSPGILVAESPSREQSIARAPTSITAFVGRTRRGPLNTPVRIRDFAEYRRVFGGLWAASTLSYAVQQYFDCGGEVAIIVRVVNGGRRASLQIPAGDEALTLEALSPGSLEALRVSVDYDGIGAKDVHLFNLVIQRVVRVGSERVLDQEIYSRLSVRRESEAFVSDALVDSQLVRVKGSVPPQRPAQTLKPSAGSPVDYIYVDDDGCDGETLTDYDLIGSATERTGIFALDSIDVFNLLCIPPLSREYDIGPTTLLAAVRYCRRRNAILLVDPPADWRSVDDAMTGLRALNFASADAAMFFPRLRLMDPLASCERTFAPCGVIAGVIARNDRRRNVWSAPAGENAVLRRGIQPAFPVTEEQSKGLASLGINALCKVRGGTVIVSARTMAAAESPHPAWRNLATRRLALHIVESLGRGTRWAVFEPNDEVLWAKVRSQVEHFMLGLYAGGAFKAECAEEGFVVRCDAETTTAADADRGVVNIEVGFAALRAGEFLTFRIAQQVGESAVPSVIKPAREIALPPAVGAWTRPAGRH